ncbi:hypothetical protein BDK51DRAFT_41141 [Blyttiomyces helicus]|uniref:Uncharacterized protein n=1 Tax=Blyttiomyces helicus TaxID=388810 RepID=A0A4P9WJH2_9FUNG|nr:hypothetical protein BDK51DRAFT_41141 [Blyttiomyces helicus]|eukprot:RKO92512.1 hypothetical protein BDK51DRAFT_41141 [Blyttiomyces helicus]
MSEPSAFSKCLAYLGESGFPNEIPDDYDGDANASTPASAAPSLAPSRAASISSIVRSRGVGSCSSLASIPRSIMGVRDEYNSNFFAGLAAKSERGGERLAFGSCGCRESGKDCHGGGLRLEAGADGDRRLLAEFKNFLIRHPLAGPVCIDVLREKDDVQVYIRMKYVSSLPPPSATKKFYLHTAPSDDDLATIRDALTAFFHKREISTYLRRDSNIAPQVCAQHEFEDRIVDEICEAVMKERSYINDKNFKSAFFWPLPLINEPRLPDLLRFLLPVALHSFEYFFHKCSMRPSIRFVNSGIADSASVEMIVSAFLTVARRGAGGETRPNGDSRNEGVFSTHDTHTCTPSSALWIRYRGAPSGHTHIFQYRATWPART